MTEISSLTNPGVKYVRRLQAERRFREREGAFVVEGTRWLAEVVRLGVPPGRVYYTAAWAARPEQAALLAQLPEPAQPVSDAAMAAMSDTESPAGVLVVLPMPRHARPGKVDFLLILDEIRIPGNLGTMLRTAAAAGVDAVLLSPGCVDAYNPKVVRGGMGAHLRLPVVAADWPEIRQWAAGLHVWLAAADGATVYTDVAWSKPSALIIGSEAVGAGSEAKALAPGRVAIPMHAATESLNAAVATGILLFEAVRQRAQPPTPSG